jgi:hypothetical protein
MGNVGEALLSRIEDAGLNASAPPQQRWLDGWLLRFSPGKAKRARCINALADGRLTLSQRLALSQAVYREAELPLFFRMTPFSQPAGLDAWLAARGMHRVDDQGSIQTEVLVCRQLEIRIHLLLETAGLKGDLIFARLHGYESVVPLRVSRHAARALLRHQLGCDRGTGNGSSARIPDKAANSPIDLRLELRDSSTPQDNQDKSKN